MTLIVVLILGAGAILIASAFDGTPILQTFGKLYTGESLNTDFGANSNGPSGHGNTDNGGPGYPGIVGPSQPNYDTGMVRTGNVGSATPLPAVAGNLETPHIYVDTQGMSFQNQMGAIQRATKQGMPVLLGLANGQTMLVRATDSQGIWAADASERDVMRHYPYATIARAQPYGLVIPEA